MQDFLLKLDNGDATTVATNKERIDGIEARLTKIDQHLGIVQLVRHASLWSWAGDHKIVAGLILAAILGAFRLVGSAFHSQANEYLDGRIYTQVGPVTSQLATINERTIRIEATLAVLQAQLISQKYAAVQPKELKPHVNELRTVKTNLASVDHSTPGFWPVSFQIIRLLSLGKRHPKAVWTKGD